MVSAAFPHDFLQFVIGHQQFFCQCNSHRVRKESCDVTVSNLVFLVHPSGVFFFLFVSHLALGSDRTFYRRYDIKFDSCRVARCFIEGNRYLIIFPKRYLMIPKPSVFRSPYKHITFPGSERAPAFIVGLLTRHGIKLGIVIQLELHQRVFYRFAFAVRHGYNGLAGRCIMIDDIDFRITCRLFHHLFRTVIRSECFGMHQHAAIRRSVEPAQVKYGFRLAGTQKIPLAVDPRLDPRMVIVGMGPTRRIHLTGRYADRA